MDLHGHCKCSFECDGSTVNHLHTARPVHELIHQGHAGLLHDIRAGHLLVEVFHLLLSGEDYIKVVVDLVGNGGGHSEFHVHCDLLYHNHGLHFHYLVLGHESRKIWWLSLDC